MFDISDVWKKVSFNVEVDVMTDQPCYTAPTDTNTHDQCKTPHDERIIAIVRFMARCAAKSKYNELHDLLERDLNNEN